MIFINEWLPNPTGDDAKGEFIELFNNGSAPVSLRGWILKASGKKFFTFGSDAIITPNEYLVVSRAVSKLSLKNSDENLFLYDASGKLDDRSSFQGMATEGQSMSRVNYGTDPSEHFAWGTPTPGVANKVAIHTSLAANVYPFDTPLNGGVFGDGSSGGLGGASFFGPTFGVVFGLALAVGAILAALVIYSLKRDENLSKLFFPRD